MSRSLALALALVPSLAWAQTCPTRPLGDNSNACASTAFVQNTVFGLVNPGTIGQVGYYSGTQSISSSPAMTISGGLATLPTPTIDTNFTWKYNGTTVGAESIGNPATTSPAGSAIVTLNGTVPGGTTAYHIIPASGPLAGTVTTTELVIGATPGQSFGGNYGRWSFSTFSDTIAGIVGEYGGTTAPTAFDLQDAIENPPSTFTVYGYWKAVAVDGGAEDVQAGAIQFGQNQPNPGTQQNRLVLLKPNIGAPGQRDSDTVLWEAKANDGTERAAWWRAFVDVQNNAGTPSAWTVQSNLNGAGWNTRLAVSDAGALTITSINAFTLGGTIAGGGNQINNVIIGTSTPLAGFFTTLSATTSVTSPIHYGGSAAGSSLSLISTSGVGTTDSILFKTGNAGATLAGTINTSGQWAIGTQVPDSPLTINSNTGTLAAAFAASIHIIAADSANAGMTFDTFASPSSFAMRRASGTRASPSATTAANIAGFFAYGYGATAYSSTSRASLAIDGAETWSDTAQGTLMRFTTTPAGGTATAEAFRIGSTQIASAAVALGFGSTSQKIAWSATAPSISSGFCTSPSISNNNGTAAFTITIGSACGASTGVLTMPTASVGWSCHFNNVTNPNANTPYQTASTTTSVSITNYVRTTGVAGNWTASDVVTAECTAY